jgi:hypothetical protein
MATFNQPEQHLNSANQTDRIRILRIHLDNQWQSDTEQRGRGH